MGTETAALAPSRTGSALGTVTDLAAGATLTVHGAGCADRTRSVDLEATLQAGYISLDQIIEARWLSRSECNPDPAERQRFLRLIPELERLYGDGHGGPVQDTYFSRHIRAGAVLTADNEIHLRYPPDSVAAVSPEFEEAIWRCTSLSRQGFSDMDAVDRHMALRILHSLAVYLLGVLDAQHAGTDASRATDREASIRRIEQSIATANNELDQAAAFIEQAGRRTSLRRYTQAMPMGVFLVVLLGWALTLAGSEFDRSLTVGILAAGGIGAVISVMARITRGKMDIDPRAGGFAVRLSGAFRPVLGAVFGVALYVVVMSGLAPVAVPEDEATRAYFFYTLAFLAGFSERLAQDVFTAAEQTIRPAARMAQTDASVVPRRRRKPTG